MATPSCLIIAGSLDLWLCVCVCSYPSFVYVATLAYPLTPDVAQ